MLDIINLSQTHPDDLQNLSSRGSTLAELFFARLPVPPTFLIPSLVFQDRLDQTTFESILKNSFSYLNLLKPAKTIHLKQKISRQLFQTFSQEISLHVVKLYNQIGAGYISLTPDFNTSQKLSQPVFNPLIVKGDANVINAIQKLFIDSVLADLNHQLAIHAHCPPTIRYPHIIIQSLPKHDSSGSAYTQNPLNNSKDQFCIEAIWGHFLPLINGQINPDEIIFDHKSNRLKHYISPEQYTFSDLEKNRLVSKKVSQKKATMQKLQKEDIKDLVQLIHKVRRYFYMPQKITWIHSHHTFHILEVSPLHPSEITPTKLDDNNLHYIGSGIPASPGIVSGQAYFLDNIQKLNSIPDGSIIIVDSFLPQHTPILSKASAIISASGGIMSHATVLSREFKIPAIVNFPFHHQIHPKEIITLNGFTGKVYKGRSHQKFIPFIKPQKPLVTPETASKIYLSPSRLNGLSFDKLTQASGVGPLDISLLYKHFSYNPFLKNQLSTTNQFLEFASEYLSQLSQKLGSKPLFLQLTDSYKHISSVPENGYAYEYTGINLILNNHYLFNLESELITKLKKSQQNLHVNLITPGIIHPQQALELKKILAKHHLTRRSNQKIYLAINNLATLCMLPKINTQLFDGYLINLPKIINLELQTVDHNPKEFFSNQNIQELVDHLLSLVPKKTHLGKTNILCLDSFSSFLDLKRALDSGFIHFSITPDSFHLTKTNLHQLEQKLASKNAQNH